MIRILALTLLAVVGLAGCEEEEPCCWVELPLPSRTYEFLDIWGTSPNNVYAVGWGSEIVHCDSSDCTFDEGDGRGFSCIWGSSDSDIYAVGHSGALHFDGEKWSDAGIEPEGARRLEDIWGSSSEDIYIVGYNHGGTVPPTDPESRILHFDGVEWTVVENSFPTLLFAVWGSSSTNVFAVGSESNDSSYHGTIYHYDGIAWSVMKENIPYSLYHLWGTSGTDVYAFGQTGAVLYYDGHIWTELDVPLYSTFYSAWGSSSDNLFVTTRLDILNFDGNSWVNVDSGFNATFEAFWGSSPKDVFAAGFKWVGYDTQGIIIRNTCELDELRTCNQ
jgi:hypothetical protein